MTEIVSEWCRNTPRNSKISKKISKLSSYSYIEKMISFLLPIPDGSGNQVFRFYCSETWFPYNTSPEMVELLRPSGLNVT